MMTVTVTAPNGATVQFPDGTDHETINSVMAANFDPLPPKATAAQMPTFEITGPDGGKYHLNAPDEHAAVDAFSTFIKGQQQGPMPAPATSPIPSGWSVQVH
jgi:hypothetical protein